MDKEEIDQILKLGKYMNIQVRIDNEGNPSYRPDLYFEQLMSIIEKITSENASNCYIGAPGYLSVDSRWLICLCDDSTKSKDGFGTSMKEAMYNAVLRFLKLKE